MMEILYMNFYLKTVKIFFFELANIEWYLNSHLLKKIYTEKKTNRTSLDTNLLIFQGKVYII